MLSSTMISVVDAMHIMSTNAEQFNKTGYARHSVFHNLQ